MDFAGFVEKNSAAIFALRIFLDGNPKKVWTKFSLCKGWPWAREMGKAMKAMKGHKPKSILKKNKRNQQETSANKSPAQGQKSPAQGQKSPEQGQKSLAKGQKQKCFKRPASVQTLALPNETGMSLEDKMEQWQKKGNQDINQFLDSLTATQRESLWGRFSRARASMKDGSLNALWNEHCKGANSEQNKKKLLKVFLDTKGDLKKSGAYRKELLKISEVSGGLPASSHKVAAAS